MYGQPLTYFCHKILPAVYDDSMSYYEVLCKVTQKLNEIIAKGDDSDIAIQQINAEINSIWNYLKSDEFNGDIEAFVKEWLENNIAQALAPFVKQVFFGLTDNGYFCAYVPKSWSEVSFDTGAIYGTEEYGRLILRFAADGQGVIDNRYDTRTLVNVVDSLFDVEAGDGLKHEQGKLTLDLGNGLSINQGTKMVEVPIGENLRYTPQGIDVPDGDSITKGVVKLSHKVGNETDDTVAVSPQAVFAYAQPKNQ